MIIFPAIDLRRGRCVPFVQGRGGVELVSSDDPATIARHWAAQGAEWLHVVNHDGALGATERQLQALHRPDSLKVQRLDHDRPESAGEELERLLPVNLRRLKDIRGAVDIPIQFGGGIGTLDDIRLVLELGADRVVVDTIAIENPSLVAEAIDVWGADRIVVGIHALNGKAIIQERDQTRDFNGNDVDAVDLGHQMQAMGVQRVVYTELGHDGMLNGVNVEATARLSEVSDLRVVARGGIVDLEDIERLKAYEHFNIEGVITGRTIYTGDLDLAMAIEVGHRPLEQFSAGVIPVRIGENGAEFLMLYNWYYELWEFPRGAVELRETTTTSARRALDKLTGQRILRFYEGCNPRLEYVDIVRDFEIRHTVLFYLAEVDGDEVHIGDEDHCEAHWGDYQSTWELLTETAPELLPALDRAMACLQNRLVS